MTLVELLEQIKMTKPTSGRHYRGTKDWDEYEPEDKRGLPTQYIEEGVDCYWNGHSYRYSGD